MTQPGYEGWSALGDVLGGGADQRLAVKHQANLGIAADTAYKFNRASAERAKAIIAGAQQSSREGLPEALSGVYTDPKEAALAQAVLGSAASPNMHNLDKFERPGYTALNAEQQAASASGDFKRANAITAVLGDKPYQPIRAVDGNLIPDGASLGGDDFTMIPLPQTMAKVDHMQAETAQGQQRTNAAVAKSNRAPAAHAGHASHSSATSDEAAILEQARQRIAQGHAPAKVAQYLRDKGYPAIAKKIYGP